MFYINGRFLLQELTGVQRFAWHLTEELAALNSDVVVLVPRGELQSPVPSGVRVETVGARGGHLWEQLDLRRYLFIHGHPLLLNLTNSGVVGYKNQIVTRHDVAYVRVGESYSWKYRALYRLMARPLLSRARRVVTVSDFSRRELGIVHGVPLDRIAVVPNAASEHFERDSENGATVRYLLCVSSPAPHKNFGHLVNVFERAGLPDDVQLWIVGDVSGAGLVRTSVPRSSSVKWLGRVTDEKLVDLYHGAAGYISLSRYEGFGIGCVEAQKAGCPVIASNAEAHVEVLGDSAMIVNPDDEASVMNAMCRIVTDVNMAAELRRRGLQNAARFSWARSGAVLSEVVASVVSGRAR